jgi:AraC-like DNA-binding protein/mannose-6-phosphate isomerase-like protein (cupin superfamily)
MSSQTRWIYPIEGSDGIDGLDSLITLGYQNFNSAYKLDFHHHENAFEFVFIEKGKATWEVDGELYPTHAGDLFHTRPNEIHRARYNVIEPSSLWWIVVAIPKPQEGTNPIDFLTEKEQIQAILQQLQNLPRIMTAGHKFGQFFMRLRRAIEQRDGLTLLRVKLRMLDLLLQIIELTPLSQHKPQATDYKPYLQRKLSEDWSWRPTVAEISRDLNYSASHFSKIFREQAGLSPIAYLERLRIEQACHLLQASHSKMTEIANLLGYYSSQHFASTFQRYTGYSPTAWRAHQKKGAESIATVLYR